MQPQPKRTARKRDGAFAPIFIDAFRNRLKKEPWLAHARIVATGHSLGGGLAQRFAYYMWNHRTSNVPWVKTVFTFETSPVSSKRSAPGFIATPTGYAGLEINRIYNRGEVLAPLRFLHRDLANHENGQIWTDYRYAAGWT